MGDKLGGQPYGDTSPDTIAARERARQAAALRAQGHTWTQIANELDYASDITALRAVKNFLARHDAETADEYRTVISERYELLWSKTWTEIASASGRGKLVGIAQLIASARGILDSHARLLGIANPKVEVTGKLDVVTETDRELAALTQRLLAGAAERGVSVDPSELPALTSLANPDTEGETVRDDR